MGEFAQFLVSGLSTGAIYAFVGIGFAVVYKGTKVVNFAHGEHVMVAGIAASFLASSLDLPLVLLVPVVLLGGVVMGLLTEVLTARFLGRPGPLIVTIGTVGLGIIIKSGMLLLTKGATFNLEQWPGRDFRIAGAFVSRQALWNVALTAIAAVLLRSFFMRSRHGLAIQATADDPETASLFGVSEGGTALWTFGLAGFFAALAGLLFTPVGLMSVDTGTLLGLKGFAAAMLGGLGSMPGALVGGLLLGLLEAAVASYVSSAYAVVVAFVVLLGVLFVMPGGLFNQSVAERV